MPFVESIGSTILEANEAMQSAKIGVGGGLLLGYSINRRWLDRPVDPAVGVIRVDTIEGKPMAVIGNFACHAVVMGYDNFLISGDWPGYASRNLEEMLGEDCVAIFMQGGAGDVNPLTETVQEHLTNGDPVITIGELTSYYGDKEMALSEGWNIEDRAGGTFAECEALARAYSAEVQRIWRRIKTVADSQIWSEHIMVDAGLSDDEAKPETIPDFFKQLIPGISNEALRLEIMLIGIGNTVIVGQPGESFSETSLDFRKVCQQLGYDYAMFVTYANGSYGYLPPENAFSEGGYEVDWPLAIGISRYTQARIQTAIMPILKKHIPK
ncbi:MAG: neutral/alkaline non-lysosomal ceramidase N-terminal domain-containing protein [Anaerolineae bacterium]|nr:neutral/alkaline non-lysosomal ceramidase N-terminal domain-containing protein [Anaerolineae bacterium]